MFFIILHTPPHQTDQSRVKYCTVSAERVQELVDLLLEACDTNQDGRLDKDELQEMFVR